MISLSKKKLYKYNKIIFFFASIILMGNVLQVDANIMCNDGTTSPSCMDCHRGCCSHHGGCAAGRSYTNSSKKNSSSSKKVTTTIKKDTNNNLKKLKIDNHNIPIRDNMEYTTIKDKVSIIAELESKKAKVKYNKNVNLIHGYNRENIEVTSESGIKKIYHVNIKKVNNNNDIEGITINGNEVSKETMEYSVDNSNVNIEVISKDQYATAEYHMPETLFLGDNKVNITVTAENGDKKEYLLTIKYHVDKDKFIGYITNVIEEFKLIVLNFNKNIKNQ